MTLRLLRGIAAGICLLLVLATAYRAGASPPAPGKGGDISADKVALDGATERRLVAHTLSSEIEPSATTMTEDFEGAWPAPGWEAADLSDVDGGEYFWGRRNCHPHSGSFAGWAAGGGAQGGGLACSDSYPNNARSWAVYGPFDLRGASAASLTYHFWGRTEVSQTCAFDFLFVGSSADGSNFAGPRYCGNWTGGDAGNGYYQRALDLSGQLGQAEVWVAFVLASDSSVTDNGIAIDDITLDINTGTPTNTPTPTRPPTNTPTATHAPTSTPTATSAPTSTPAATGAPTSTPTPTTPPQSTPTAQPSATADQAPDPRLSYLPLVAKPFLPPPTATPPPASPYDGFWQGTTSQGRSISFRVSQSAITYLQAGYDVGDCTVTVYNYATTSFSGNTFQVAVQRSDYSYNVSGTFSSDTAASGTLKATENGSFCNGSVNLSWTATKRP
jgi:cell division septation protein DedD